ncbi:MAG: cupin domain-containing protein [Pseudomonadota bacterium]
MEFPEFMQSLPGLDVPFPPDAVRMHAVRSEEALVVYFTVLADLDVPEHSHGPQWGAIFEGEVELTIAGATKIYRPGDTWDIPDGAPHAARIKAGSRLMDVFSEPDRYALK